MAKVKTNTTTIVVKPEIRRKGIHAKTKTSNSKNNKNYEKKYRGQGK